jgi:hypothetical protein
MLPESVSKQVVLSYWATSAHITNHNNLPSRASNALYSHSRCRSGDDVDPVMFGPRFVATGNAQMFGNCQIYFQNLPIGVKSRVLKRLAEVLSGEDVSEDFGHLTESDRSSIKAILDQTLKTS